MEAEAAVPVCHNDKYKEPIISRPSSIYRQGRSSIVSVHADTKTALSNIHIFIRKCIKKNGGLDTSYADYDRSGRPESLGSELMDEEENERRESLTVRLRQNFSRRQSWSNAWNNLRDKLTSRLKYHIDPYGENTRSLQY